MDLLSLLAWVSIIFAFSFIILFATITYISNRISLLGIYHKLKSSENPNGEEFLNKVVEVSKCNFLLAFPMGFAFYIIIIQNIPNSDLSSCFTCSNWVVTCYIDNDTSPSEPMRIHKAFNLFTGWWKNR